MNEQVIVPAATQNFGIPVATPVSTTVVVTAATSAPSFFEKVEEEAKVEVLKVVDAIDDFVGTHVVAPVEAGLEKIEENGKELFQYGLSEVGTVESVLTEIAREVVAETEAVVAAVEAEVVQVEQAVVAEAKEGYVAGEHLVRKVLNVFVGSSHIKNPA